MPHLLLFCTVGCKQDVSTENVSNTFLTTDLGACLLYQ